MVDMGAAARFSQDPGQQRQLLEKTAAQRDAEYAGAQRIYVGGTPDTAAEAMDPMLQEFYDFYRTSRGSVGDIKSHTTHPTMTSNVKFINFYPFQGIETIAPRPLLFIAGQKAVSVMFSQDAYAKAAEPKELYIVPEAGHALQDERGFGGQKVRISEDMIGALATFANGDARTALSTLEMVVLNGDVLPDGSIEVSPETLEQCTARKSLLYDKNGEEHYNIISALHKSMVQMNYAVETEGKEPKTVAREFLQSKQLLAGGVQ